MQTWTELLADIKSRAAMPTSQSTFSEAQLLRYANSALKSFVMPKILKAREAFYEFDYNIAINSTGIYEIPSRSVGATVVNMSLVDTTTALSGQRRNVSWIMEDQLSDYDSAEVANVGAFVKGSQLYLVPKDGAGYSYFRITVLLRPSTIVANTSAAQITSITTGTNTIEFASIPSSWTNTDTFDLVQNKSNFDTLAADATVTTLGATSAIFSDTLPSRLAVGDWFCLGGTSPVVQCPEEWLPVVAQHAANSVLRAQGDMKAVEAGTFELKSLVEDSMITIEPRIKQQGRKIVNSNGVLRRGGNATGAW